MIGWNFDNSYARLPAVFFEPASPARVRAPRIVLLNHRLADDLGLSLRELPADHAAAIFAGQQLPDGAQPIAQAYAGHQFGGFTMLGDGRAILWGEQLTPAGSRVDLQFKGSGPTIFSRRGDGRAALGPMLREYIISEAMQALGIPTTRSLAVVLTGEPVYRETMLKGAILTRVAASHLRVGTFQYAAARRDEANLRVLADYAIARHESQLSDSPQKYLEFLRAVIARQAALIAQWQLVGFVHGVMNTDNMALSGETIDYGPCAFLDTYHQDMVFSSIDHGGRYAYGNQPSIGQWNLTRFAETLLPLIDSDPQRAVALAVEALNEFAPAYRTALLRGMCRKLGLLTAEPDDAALVEALLAWMQEASADFTNTFDDLSTGAAGVGEPYDNRFRAWQTRWHDRLRQAGQSLADAQSHMQAVNPAVIPRNHRVEEALAAAEGDDLGPLERLLAVLATPFERSAATRDYREPPPPSNCRYRTFCGT